MMRRGLALAALLALVIAGCGDDAALVTTATTTTTTTTATTTAAAPTTTTTEAVTTTAAAPTTATTTTASGPVSRCAAVPTMTLPADETDLIRIPGSFDGDPQPLSIMASDGAILFRSAGSWWIGFSLNIDYVVFEPVPAPSNPGFTPEIVSVLDFGPLDDGALVSVDQSMLSGDEVYVFYFLDAACQVADAGTATTDPLQFLLGGGAVHHEGLECTPSGVIAKQSGALGAPDRDNWQITETTYVWDPTGTGFMEAATITHEVGPSDPEVGGVAIADC